MGTKFIEGNAYITSKEFVSRLTGIDDIKIPEFTPKDIPIGELCWTKTICKTDFDEWDLGVFDGNLYSGDVYIVPSLIAKTKEDAERLKGWTK